MYIILIAIFAAVVSGIILFWVHSTDAPAPKWVETVVIVFVLFAVLVGGIWAGYMGSSNSAREKYTDEYNQLKLYQYTVEHSTNEYLRFDYYTRVQEWNEKYANIVEMESNPWVSWFFFDPVRDCGPIEFELHGDMEYEIPQG